MCVSTVFFLWLKLVTLRMPHHQKAVSGAETTDLWGSGPDAWQGEPRAPLPGGHKQQKVPYEKGTIARILPEKKFGKHYRQLVLKKIRAKKSDTSGQLGTPPHLLLPLWEPQRLCGWPWPDNKAGRKTLSSGGVMAKLLWRKERRVENKAQKISEEQASTI